jgi:hypothetical protein
MAMKTNDNPAGVIVAREFGLTVGEKQSGSTQKVGLI